MNNFIKKRPIETSALAFILLFLAVVTADAHGENRPGPNGGQIRMPGPFHTEVIAHPNGFQIYLLDINFKNPVVSNSAVKASIKSDGKVTELKCEIHPDHFFCPTPNVPKIGKLVIQPTRDAAKGNAAQYDLPF